MPLSTSSAIFACWAGELIAPMSVFLSSGSPSRSVSIRVFEPVDDLVVDDSWTSSREPAQQTWPWLK